MKFIGFLLAAALLWGCQPGTSVDPLTTGPEPEPYRIIRDSIKTGTYLGIAIGEQAASVYPKIQALQATKGVTGLYVVSNVFADLIGLKERLPLYQYILLDQKPGTDSGVQITVEGQTVKSIYLNSGKRLTQWPEKQAVNSSVRVGDAVSTLYDKLVNIRNIDRYTNKFEYISLSTKNLLSDYDGGMSQSPQWYFVYSTGLNQMDQIQVHFRDGKVSKIYIDHYSKY
ncbi:hypothetical protein [Spirosoma linguale]|uniref:Lipoprotein n=1 Tax=Spirosoma linguale (strain ATCC 33905 / DSM 74 / LMG 10896 / Claus 1) TaxID=504472 RepID=D2QDK5_SPILD|nr:hypothetical protein Slin_2097 [Spirosoma linguale DSM 74]